MTDHAAADIQCNSTYIYSYLIINKSIIFVIKIKYLYAKKINEMLT